MHCISAVVRIRDIIVDENERKTGSMVRNRFIFTCQIWPFGFSLLIFRLVAYTASEKLGQEIMYGQFRPPIDLLFLLLAGIHVLLLQGEDQRIPSGIV